MRRSSSACVAFSARNSARAGPDGKRAALKKGFDRRGFCRNSEPGNIPSRRESPEKFQHHKAIMAKDKDLFDSDGAASSKGYTAKDIEVLEGLEPVRRRPGMYIGGTDERALHHLAAEILDNAMDEAVAGYANRIEVELSAGDVLSIRDNGRGIPTDPHPKFKSKSALEVIMTTLHAGGKFGGKVYDTSGGLHGVGASVVNALSEWMEVDVARDKRAHVMRFERGKPVTKLKDSGAVNRRGTTVSFKPDRQIFGKETHFSPSVLYRMARSKAYLFRGVEIRWQ